MTALTHQGSRRAADESILAAMRELDREADVLEAAAAADAIPKSKRVAQKRERAQEIRRIRNDLDSIRVSLLDRGRTPTEIVDAMPHDGNSILFVWYPKSNDPRFRKVPVEAVMDAVVAAFNAARPPLSDQVLPLPQASA